MAKKKHEEHENHERWLVSYADFITLLFAFFVVMYSVSSVNEGKYRTVSDSIKAALNPVNSIPSSRLPFSIGDTKPKMIPPEPDPVSDPVIRRMREIVSRINPLLKGDIADVKIVETGHGSIMISLPESILFQSGEARVRSEALPFLKALSAILIEMGRHIRILGHTDNVPIRTAQFPSNWELSAVRAVMVVRIFSELYEVPISHLSATGFADSKPVATNDTPEGRTKNRRVEIIVLENQAGEESLDALLPAGGSSAQHL